MIQMSTDLEKLQRISDSKWENSTSINIKYGDGKNNLNFAQTKMGFELYQPGTGYWISNKFLKMLTQFSATAIVNRMSSSPTTPNALSDNFKTLRKIFFYVPEIQIIAHMHPRFSKEDNDCILTFNCHQMTAYLLQACGRDILCRRLHHFDNGSPARDSPVTFKACSLFWAKGEWLRFLWICPSLSST